MFKFNKTDGIKVLLTILFDATVFQYLKYTQLHTDKKENKTFPYIENSKGSSRKVRYEEGQIFSHI